MATGNIVTLRSSDRFTVQSGTHQWYLIYLRMYQYRSESTLARPDVKQNTYRNTQYVSLVWQ